MPLNWTINVGHAPLNTNIKEKKEEHESYIITSKFDSPPKMLILNWFEGKRRFSPIL